MTTFHLVRHGQSTWNVEGRLQGQAPGVPLTGLGRSQVERAALALRSTPVDAVFTSDLLRAAQTAAVIGAGLGIEPVPTAALREQSLGDLEGRLTRNLAAEPTPAGLHVTEVRWGGGESIADVHARVGAFLADLLNELPGKHVVLVSHADAIRAALAWLRGLGPREVEWVEVDHCRVITVEPAGFAAMRPPR